MGSTLKRYTYSSTMCSVCCCGRLVSSCSHRLGDQRLHGLLPLRRSPRCLPFGSKVVILCLLSRRRQFQQLHVTESVWKEKSSMMIFLSLFVSTSVVIGFALITVSSIYYPTSVSQEVASSYTPCNPSECSSTQDCQDTLSST